MPLGFGTESGGAEVELAVHKFDTLIERAESILF